MAFTEESGVAKTGNKIKNEWTAPLSPHSMFVYFFLIPGAFSFYGGNLNIQVSTHFGNFQLSSISVIHFTQRQDIKIFLNLWSRRGSQNSSSLFPESKYFSVTPEFQAIIKSFCCEEQKYVV